MRQPINGPSLSLLRRSPKFGLLWFARTVSFAGDSLAHIALVLYVADRGGGGPAVAALLLVSDFAPAVFAPFLGSMGDRIDRRRLMIATAATQGVIVLAIAAWLPGLAPLLVLVAVNSLVAQVFAPASSSAVGQLVADTDLGLANSMIGFGTYGLAIAGPLGVAVLLPLVGLRGVLIVDALSFAASAALLIRLPALPSAAVGATVWRSALSGLRYMWRNRIVRIVVLGFAALVACTALDDVALVFLAKHTLGVGNSAASVLYAGADIGLLVGFAVLTRISRLSAGLLFIIGMGISSAGNLLTGGSWLISLAISSQILRGFGIAAQDNGITTLLQRYVPSGLQSRVFANYGTAIGLGAGISYLGGGIALASTSPRLVLVIAGALGVLIAAGTGIALRSALRASR